MNENYPLDQLIRFKHRDEKRINFKKEKVVHILERTGRIIPYHGILTPFIKVKSYVVNRENTAEHETKCIVNDVSSDHRITLIVKYKIRCLKNFSRDEKRFFRKFFSRFTGRIKTTLLSFHINVEDSIENKIVRALYKEEDPAASLHKLIEIWIRQYRQIGGDKAFILNFFSLRKDLVNVLEQKAEMEIGVNLKLRIKLEYEDDWDAIPIESESFPIMLKGGDDKIMINFKTDLYRNVSPDRHVFALARRHRLEKIEKWMPSRIAAFINKNCILQEIFFKPRIKLRTKIIDHLNNTLLKDEGRHMTSLALGIDIDFDFPTPFITEDFEVEIDVEGERDKLTLIYRLVIVIENLDLFRVFKLADFRAWFGARLNYATKSVFHSKTYTELIIDLSSRLPEIEAELKKRITKYTDLVGYCLQEVNLITDVEELKYREGYHVAIAADNVTFATQDNRIKVAVRLAVSGSIRNMYAFKKEISWKFQNKVDSAAKTYLLAKLKGIIKKTAPERFYSHIFDYEQPEGGIEIVKELKETIAAMLQQWDTSNMKIEFELLETEVLRRIKALRQKAIGFNATVFPYAAKGYGEKISIDGTFVVVGISKRYWSVFSARSYEAPNDEINELTTYLSESISRNFNTFSNQKLHSINREVLPEIERITEETIQKIERVYGLNIQIVHFNRRPILSEEIAFKQQRVFSSVSVLVKGLKKNFFNGKAGDTADK